MYERPPFTIRTGAARPGSSVCDTGAARPGSDCLLPTAYCLLPTAYCLLADLETIVAGLQQRYASVNTITASFQQIYRAPGIEQIESGVFWLKKPGLMRWEYRDPEEKIFVADGRDSFLFVPQDRQVMVRPISAEEMRATPLRFLLGTGNINKGFVVSWDTEFKPKAAGTQVIRLTPRGKEAEYSFLVLELDQKTFDLRRIVIHEPSSNSSEFIFTNMKENEKVDPKQFQFKIPKGVEIIRMTSDE
jgi:outer membrane lipoprotein carrier protein